MYFNILLLLFFAISVFRSIEVKTEKTVTNHVQSSKLFNGVFNRLRSKRQLGNLASSIKLNKQYQTCSAPGDKAGHCRHLRFCPMDSNWFRNFRFVDYLCVIQNSVVGICCPDDLIIGSPSAGANIVPNLPADGYETADSQSATDQPLQRGCGILTQAQRSHSGNGTTDHNIWPWMAALLENYNTLFCGGVLITDQHVLTAAHCTNTRRSENIRIRLGEYDFLQTTETRAVDFTVASLTQHTDFDPITYDNDIAMIKLNRRTTFNSYIWPICLPPPDMVFVNVMATATGWGRQEFQGASTSNVLREVSMPVWDNERCQKSFTQSITRNVLCAAGYEGGKDSCQGDSGGPLQYQLDNGRWVNIGIVSWGISCGELGRPGVYTRVNSYLNWIVDNTVT